MTAVPLAGAARQVSGGLRPDACSAGGHGAIQTGFHTVGAVADALEISLGDLLRETAGTAYTHLRGLGDPKDNRAPFRDGRLDGGRARLRSVLRSEAAQSDLDHLAAHVRHPAPHPPAVLRRRAVFREERESRCHRQVVPEAVCERAAVPVIPLA
ncbi:DUF488 family protein [Streptomyces tricolor]|uniref:DUF488 family protein n=1 Tax=Streptomyces tricolor TaxID=68277 RepID=UPI0036EF98D6